MHGQWTMWKGINNMNLFKKKKKQKKLLRTQPKRQRNHSWKKLQVIKKMKDILCGWFGSCQYHQLWSKIQRNPYWNHNFIFCRKWKAHLKIHMDSQERPNN